MCGFDQPAEQADAVTDTTAADIGADEIKVFDGEGNEIELPEGFGPEQILAALFGIADPDSPDTYLLTNTETGQRAFEYSPEGVADDQQPTITFELFTTPAGNTVAALKFDAAEILAAQEQIEASEAFISAGAPSGALLFTEAPLRALAQIATDFADQVAAANAEAPQPVLDDPEARSAAVVGEVR